MGWTPPDGIGVRDCRYRTPRIEMASVKEVGTIGLDLGSACFRHLNVRMAEKLCFARSWQDIGSQSQSACPNQQKILLASQGLRTRPVLSHLVRHGPDLKDRRS